MQRHHNCINANIPHLRREIMSGFQRIIIFDTLVGPFGSSSGIVDVLPLRSAAWRGIVQAEIGLHGKRKGSAELCGRTGGVTQTLSILHTRTAKFGVVAFQIRAVGLHLHPGGADGNAVRSNRDIARGGRSVFHIAGIEVNERGDGEGITKRVNRHDVVGGIQCQTGRFALRKERQEAEKGFTKSMGIVFGGGMKKWKERQVMAGICQQIQIIAGIKQISGRIPANITVGL